MILFITEFYKIWSQAENVHFFGWNEKFEANISVLPKLDFINPFKSNIDIKYNQIVNTKYRENF